MSEYKLDSHPKHHIQLVHDTIGEYSTFDHISTHFVDYTPHSFQISSKIPQNRTVFSSTFDADDILDETEHGEIYDLIDQHISYILSDYNDVATSPFTDLEKWLNRLSRSIQTLESQTDAIQVDLPYISHSIQTEEQPSILSLPNNLAKDMLLTRFFKSDNRQPSDTISHRFPSISNPSLIENSPPQTTSASDWASLTVIPSKAPLLTIATFVGILQSIPQQQRIPFLSTLLAITNEPILSFRLVQSLPILLSPAVINSPVHTPPTPHTGSLGIGDTQFIKTSTLLQVIESSLTAMTSPSARESEHENASDVLSQRSGTETARTLLHLLTLSVQFRNTYSLLVTQYKASNPAQDHSHLLPASTLSAYFAQFIHTLYPSLPTRPSSSGGESHPTADTMHDLRHVLATSLTQWYPRQSTLTPWGIADVTISSRTAAAPPTQFMVPPATIYALLSDMTALVNMQRDPHHRLDPPPLVPAMIPSLAFLHPQRSIDAIKQYDDLTHKDIVNSSTETTHTQITNSTLRDKWMNVWKPFLLMELYTSQIPALTPESPSPWRQALFREILIAAAASSSSSSSSTNDSTQRLPSFPNQDSYPALQEAVVHLVSKQKQEMSLAMLDDDTLIDLATTMFQTGFKLHHFVSFLSHHPIRKAIHSLPSLALEKNDFTSTVATDPIEQYSSSQLRTPYGLVIELLLSHHLDMLAYTPVTRVLFKHGLVRYNDSQLIQIDYPSAQAMLYSSPTVEKSHPTLPLKDNKITIISSNQALTSPLLFEDSLAEGTPTPLTTDRQLITYQLVTEAIQQSHAKAREQQQSHMQPDINRNTTTLAKPLGSALDELIEIPYTLRSSGLGSFHVKSTTLQFPQQQRQQMQNTPPTKKEIKHTKHRHQRQPLFSPPLPVDGMLTSSIQDAMTSPETHIDSLFAQDNPGGESQIAHSKDPKSGPQNGNTLHLRPIANGDLQKYNQTITNQYYSALTTVSPIKTDVFVIHNDDDVQLAWQTLAPILNKHSANINQYSILNRLVTDANRFHGFFQHLSDLSPSSSSKPSASNDLGLIALQAFSLFKYQSEIDQFITQHLQKTLGNRPSEDFSYPYTRGFLRHVTKSTTLPSDTHQHKATNILSQYLPDLESVIPSHPDPGRRSHHDKYDIHALTMKDIYQSLSSNNLVHHLYPLICSIEVVYGSSYEHIRELSPYAAVSSSSSSSSPQQLPSLSSSDKHALYLTLSFSNNITCIIDISKPISPALDQLLQSVLGAHQILKISSVNASFMRELKQNHPESKAIYTLQTFVLLNKLIQSINVYNSFIQTASIDDLLNKIKLSQTATNSLELTHGMTTKTQNQASSNQQHLHFDDTPWDSRLPQTIIPHPPFLLGQNLDSQHNIAYHHQLSKLSQLLMNYSDHATGYYPAPHKMKFTIQEPLEQFQSLQDTSQFTAYLQQQQSQASRHEELHRLLSTIQKQPNVTDHPRQNDPYWGLPIPQEPIDTFLNTHYHSFSLDDLDARVIGSPTLRRAAHIDVVKTMKPTQITQIRRDFVVNEVQRGQNNIDIFKITSNVTSIGSLSLALRSQHRKTLTRKKTRGRAPIHRYMR